MLQLLSMLIDVTYICIQLIKKKNTMSLKNLKHFEMLQLNCSIESARVNVSRHNKKNSDTIKVKKIKGRAFAYRDFFDIKEVDQLNINILKDQLLNALERIRIIESDEEII